MIGDLRDPVLCRGVIDRRFDEVVSEPHRLGPRYASLLGPAAGIFVRELMRGNRQVTDPA